MNTYLALLLKKQIKLNNDDKRKLGLAGLMLIITFIMTTMFCKYADEYSPRIVLYTCCMTICALLTLSIMLTINITSIRSCVIMHAILTVSFFMGSIILVFLSTVERSVLSTLPPFVATVTIAIYVLTTSISPQNQDSDQ